MPGSDGPILLQRAMDRAAVNLIPFHATIELTYRCNLKCQHCYVDMPGHDQLSVAELRDLLGQLADAGTLDLLFTGGEILARRDILEILGIARKHGFLFTLFTNATLLDATLADGIAEAKPQLVAISLYGANAAAHEAVTQVPGSFAAALRGASLLKARGVVVLFQTTLMKSNIQEAAPIRALAASMDIPVRFGHVIVPTKSCALNPQNYEAEAEEFARNVELGWLQMDITRPQKPSVCKAGRGVCSISPSGDVFPCIMMPMRLGNIRQMRFAEIWAGRTGPDLQRLRTLTGHDLTDCQDCRLIQYCQRCLGIALSETGSLVKAAPSACRTAERWRELYG
jgi:AdoMet-dependent heme synthase